MGRARRREAQPPQQGSYGALLGQLTGGVSGFTPPNDAELVKTKAYKRSGITAAMLQAQKKLHAEMFSPENLARAAFDRRTGMTGPSNFVGSYIGLKRVKGNKTEEPVVVAMVRRKQTNHERIVNSALIPREIEVARGRKCQTDVVEVGRPTTSEDWDTETDDLMGFKRCGTPALGGDSISISSIPLTGTLGAVVTKGDGKRYILSNNHVLAGVGGDIDGFIGRAGVSLGAQIAHPGVADRTAGSVACERIVGTLVQFHPMQLTTGRTPDTIAPPNHIDAALAECTVSPVDVSHDLHEFQEILSAPGEPELGMAVRKVGRTTGLSTGEIVGLNATVTISYKYFDRNTFQLKDAFAVFHNAFTVEGNDNDRPFSYAGDSGSVITAKSGGNEQGVGLLFAGGQQTSLRDGGQVMATFGIPIKSVFQALGITAFVNSFTA